MEFELWYLVFIPILFGAGWWTRGLEHKQRSQDSQLPECYSRGVSLLLGRDPEKAIDAFIEAARLNPDLIELHHVLGNLFRRSGEFEKAIRVHSHLAGRADLSEEERILALKELAVDFMKAGIFDRAEGAYRQLAKIPSEMLYAYHALLEIYVTEHDWDRALETARALEEQGGEDRSNEISHFLCEKADQLVKQKRLDEARELLSSTECRRSSTPRVLTTIGRIAVLQKDYREALNAWYTLKDNYPDHLAIYLPQMLETMNEMGDRSGALRMLSQIMNESPTPEVVEAGFKYIAMWKGVPEAARMARDLLEKSSSITVLETYLALKLELMKTMEDSLQDHEDELKEVQILEKGIRKHSARFKKHQCRKCGFLASNFSWHCLGCGSWDSFNPVRKE